VWGSFGWLLILRSFGVNSGRLEDSAEKGVLDLIDSVRHLSNTDCLLQMAADAR
jgi:hypothetical protein